MNSVVLISNISSESGDNVKIWGELIKKRGFYTGLIKKNLFIFINV
jgi:hypothetical protein